MCVLSDRNELEAAQKFLEQAAIENLVSFGPQEQAEWSCAVLIPHTALLHFQLCHYSELSINLLAWLSHGTVPNGFKPRCVSDLVYSLSVCEVVISNTSTSGAVFKTHTIYPFMIPD